MAMEDGFIDFRSDTVTKPTPQMRKAMYEAEVGDDYYRDDPTINKLQERAAEILGKEAGLFVGGGTMGNMVSIFTQTKRGQEIIMESKAHLWRGEAAHLGVVEGVLCNRISGNLGIMNPNEIEAAIRGFEIYEPRTGLISVETPNNGAGGTVAPLENINAIADIAKKHKLAFHIDGARIFNATVYLKINPAIYVSGATSVMFCLSKSLCCPYGSLIAGSKEFIEEARRWRLTLGGTLRQGGIMAAAGIVALDCMIDRLEEDHINARRLGERLVNDGMAKLDLKTVQTNMFRADLSPMCSNGTDLQDFLLAHKIKTSITPSGLTRFVTHYWVTAKDIDNTVDVLHAYMDRS